MWLVFFFVVVVDLEEIKQNFYLLMKHTNTNSTATQAFYDKDLIAGAVNFEYSRTCLQRPSLWPYKCGLSRQVVFGPGGGGGHTE